MMTADDTFIRRCANNDFPLGSSRDDINTRLFAIIAERLGSIEGHERFAREFGEKIAGLTPTLTVTIPSSAPEPERTAEIADAARYRWIRDHWMQVEAPPDNRPREIIMTFHRDKQSSEKANEGFDGLLDRLIRGE